MSRFLVLLVCLVGSHFVIGQNYPLYNNYISNPFLLNPAEAATDHLNIFTNYRTQWVGMNGAPKIATLGFTTLLNETQAAIGLKASSFKRGFLTTTDANLTYAYGVPLDKQNKLFFGLAGGILSNSIDWKMVDDATDPALLNLNGGMNPSLTFGALLRNASGVNVGLVIPQLFKTESFVNNNFAIAPQDNLMLFAYYSNWHASSKKKVHSHNKSKKTAKSSKNKGSPLEAYTVFRYSNVGMQLEGSLKFNFQSSFWISGTYRKVSGVIPGIGINMGPLSVAYFYESGVAGDFPLKSHEIALNLKVGEEKKFKGDKPVVKPVPPPTVRPRFGVPNPTDPKISKQTQKSSNKTTAKANRNNNKTEVKTQPVTQNNQTKSNPTTNTVPNTTTTEVKKDPIVTQTETKKDPVTTTTEEKKDPVVTTTEEKKDPVTEEKKDPVTESTPRLNNQNVTETLTHATEEERLQHEEEQEKLARLSEHKENPTEEHEEDGHPHAERHEFYQRGDHASELDYGTHIIVGAFKSDVNAKHMADELKKLGFSGIDYGYLSSKGVWYIHFSGFEDIEAAKAQRNKYRKMKMFKDAWLLTVHQ